MELPERWAALCGRIGRGDDAAALWLILEALYAHPTRAYHSLSHIADCLRVLDNVRHLAAAPDEVEAALWLHDCIYVPGRTDNEERSAAVWGVFARTLNVATAAADRVSWLIMATTHRDEFLSGDAAVVADIDMAILAAPAAAYDRYAAAIRQEFAFASDQEYRRGRSAFIRGVLRAKAIYRSEPLARRWEQGARDNLSRELALLEPAS